MNARKFLEDRDILIKDAKRFPINLTRDTHVGTANDIVNAMQNYSVQIVDSFVNYLDANGYLIPDFDPEKINDFFNKIQK